MDPTFSSVPYKFFLTTKVNIFISNNLEKLIRIIQSKKKSLTGWRCYWNFAERTPKRKGYILNANVIHCSHKLLFNHAKSEIQKEKNLEKVMNSFIDLFAK